MEVSRHKELLKAAEDAVRSKELLCCQLQQQLHLLQQEKQAGEAFIGSGSDTIKACHQQPFNGNTFEGLNTAPRIVQMNPAGLHEGGASPMMGFSVNTQGLKGLDLRLDFA